MAHDCSDHRQCLLSAISTSSTLPNWWDINLHHHATPSSSSWTSIACPIWNQANPSSNSSCEKDVLSMSPSITSALSRSALSVDEPVSSNNLLLGHGHANGLASDIQLWSQILLGVGSYGEMNENQDVGENLLDALSSKSMSPSTIFEPEYDYLKKMDNTNWEYTNSSSSFNNFGSNKHQNNYGTKISLIDDNDHRMNKFSNLVRGWSIAPPDPEIDNQLDPIRRNISLKSSTSYDFLHPQPFRGNSSLGIKEENGHGDIDSTHENNFRRSLIGLNETVVGGSSKLGYYGVPNSVSCPSARNFGDSLSYSSRLAKPLVDIQFPKLSFESLQLSDSGKQGHQTSSSTGKTTKCTNEGRKKRTEDSSNQSSIPIKKPKQESSTSSSVKVQAPKVKISDKITALQQIVSPFGKTDTASVLSEAIQYIKFLQEQVKLLSNPYHVNTNAHKDRWGRNDYKGDNGKVVNLRSRGLCLVPVSCAPQVYHDSSGPDFWTPTYRGCLYR